MLHYADNLRLLANELEQQRQALERLRFCFDVYLDHTENGAVATEHMDTMKAEQQLVEAVRNLLGYPQA